MFRVCIIGDMEERLPLKIGIGFVIGSDCEPVLFTEKQARKRAETEFDPALKRDGFTMRFFHSDYPKLGIDKPPCWIALYGKLI